MTPAQAKDAQVQLPRSSQKRRDADGLAHFAIDSDFDGVAHRGARRRRSCS
jgi:hypothetical protein